jgi:hypothetical protein
MKGWGNMCLAETLKDRKEVQQNSKDSALPERRQRQASGFSLPLRKVVSKEYQKRH